MRITNIERVTMPVYDVVNATPYHNFLIKCNRSGYYIVSHNC